MGNTLKAVNLHTAITTAKLFAGNDATLPMLNAVRLEFAESQLVAVATDRFVLGVQRVDYSGEAFAVMLSAPDVVNLARIAKTATRDQQWRDVEVEITREQFWPAGADSRTDAPTERPDGRVATVAFRFNSGEAITIQTLDVEFPKYRQLIPSDDTVTVDPAGVKGFNAGYLAKFSKVPGSHQMVVSVGKPGKPAVISIGDDFIGLIMPVRLADYAGATYSRPGWLEA